VQLLDAVEALVELAPPDPGPRRFGNISFRKWNSLLEERVDSLMTEFIASEVLQFGVDGEKKDGGSSKLEPEDGIEVKEDVEETHAVDELKAYFLGSFGSAQRLDYGTGHELSFVAFLGGLWKLGAFKDGVQDEEVERSIVLSVIER
jgi:serine/threonine-protein phosphatase 2A activator